MSVEYRQEAYNVKTGEIRDGLIAVWDTVLARIVELIIVRKFGE